MQLIEVLQDVRAIAGDKDPATYRYTDNEVIVAMSVVCRNLGVRRVAGLATLAFVTTEGLETVTPDPTTEQAAIIATATAIHLLQQTYRRRVDDGSLGVTWQSGLEQESTISQQKAYSSMITELKQELEALQLIATAATFATRPQ